MTQWSTIWTRLGAIFAAFLVMIAVFLMAERRVRARENLRAPNAPDSPPHEATVKLP